MHYTFLQGYPMISAGRPGSSEVARKPLTRRDVSSIPANGIFLTKKLENKIKMPNGWKTIKSLVHKIRLSCVTPAGTPIDVQNEWEENTHTHTHTRPFLQSSDDNFRLRR